MRKLFQAILNLCRRIFGKSDKEDMMEQSLIEEMAKCDIAELEEQKAMREKRKIKRSLKERLYVLKQEIIVFETIFPNEYAVFLSRIEELEKQYEASLEEMKKTLTFSIDPDIDWGKIGEVVQLEKDIKRFIETEVRFIYLSDRIQRLIVKLNILYNVSIFHSKSSEKQKVISQLEHAVQSENRIMEEFLESEEIINEKRLNERMLNLLSYTDYLILKSRIRNSDVLPSEALSKLITSAQFERDHYIEAFKNFIKDEVYDLAELLHLIEDEECRKILKENAGKIIVDLTYSEALETRLSSKIFWDHFFEFEASMLEMLKGSGIEEDGVKVKLIARMNIQIEEDDVLTSPMANSYLALTSLFTSSHDIRILLLLKILKELPKEVTYKEIYFLALLFEAVPIIEGTNSSLSFAIRKYKAKYPYEAATIKEKKRSVKSTTSREYVAMFSLDEYAQEIQKGLEDLNIDFKVLKDKVFINSFYFNGLPHIVESFNNKHKYIA